MSEHRHSPTVHPPVPWPTASLGFPGSGHPYASPWVHEATRAAAAGAMVGAMLGAARALKTPAKGDERWLTVGQGALREATRIGLATGIGAAAASLLPTQPLVRGLATVGLGAAVLAAEDRPSVDLEG